MSQRFFRCRVCGQPHEIDTLVCPVGGVPIPARRSLLPASDPDGFDESTEPSIPGPARLPQGTCPTARRSSRLPPPRLSEPP
ncbi:MAG: hypothetical protein WCJ30_15700, partial [Deltaproteobacteria bacterium]